jgi:Peptidase inhibitor family I36
MRKTLCVLLAAAFALLTLLSTASAAPSTDKTVVVPQQREISAQALSCTPGDMCAWPVANGSERRCSWTNRDNNWQAAPVTCSWSGDNPVRAVFNNGRSSNAGVCLYTQPNYGGNIAYFVRQREEAPNFPNVIIRSHKWVPRALGCWD